MHQSRMVAVIMAGGGGTRFWPRSRKNLPKQFLSFDGTKSLLEQTVDRLRPILPPERILIVTGAEHADLAAEHARLPRSSVIGEPAGRDTAACIALGARLAQGLADDPVMLVLSADHLIHPVEMFQATLLRAAEIADRYRSLVSIGIRPDRPATGYGYIEIGARIDDAEPSAFQTKSFREKPDLETARRLILGGNFLWNSGMFAFRTDTIRAALAEHLPEMEAALDRLSDPRRAADLARVYPELPKISIDYGIMERASNRMVVEGRFEWDDLGTFEAVARHANRQGDHNLYRGEAVVHEAKGVLVDNDAPGLVVVSGLDDVLVVRTKDAVLVLPRRDAERVKDVVKELKARGLERYL